MRDPETERGRVTGRGRSREPDAELDPGTPGSPLSLRQILNC